MPQGRGVRGEMEIPINARALEEKEYGKFSMGWPRLEGQTSK